MSSREHLNDITAFDSSYTSPPETKSSTHGPLRSLIQTAAREREDLTRLLERDLYGCTSQGKYRKAVSSEGISRTLVMLAVVTMGTKGSSLI